jgi:hypothetical protein
MLEKLASLRGGMIVAGALLVGATPFVLFNQLRPLLFPLASWSPMESIFERPRTDLYFADQREFQAPHLLRAAAAVREVQCANVGIDTNLDPYIYPLMALIGADAGHRKVQFTGVRNSTAQYNRLQAPCAVVCTACANVPWKWSEYASTGGRASVFGDVVVFSHSGVVANPHRQQPEHGTQRPHELLTAVDRSYSELKEVDLTAVSLAVDKVQQNRFFKRRDLQARLAIMPAILARAETLHRALEPQRIRATENRFSRVDYETVLIADDALKAWKSELLEERANVQALASRLATD